MRRSTRLPLQAMATRTGSPPGPEQKGADVAYVSKKDLIEKLQPLLERLRQVASELEAAVDEVNDVFRDVDAALSEGED